MHMHEYVCLCMHMYSDMYAYVHATGDDTFVLPPILSYIITYYHILPHILSHSYTLPFLDRASRSHVRKVLKMSVLVRTFLKNRAPGGPNELRKASPNDY